ncbi:MAG TPA: type II toxin-antitoxin system VapC family toxin [Verrucomicrobiae bacterium]|nr:type II toxin-antitoxin system VapC family toxin [Verrucomicrobiae bacterium]
MTTRTASELFLVDSPGWLEYLSEDSKAAAFGHYLENEAAVIVPSLVIFEVYRQVSRLRGKSLADRFLSQALHCRVVNFDEMTAVAAANASLEHRLSMPEAILYATARTQQAQLVTSNTRFRGLPQAIIL